MKKVNIIGSGISGLTAGCYLQQNGFQTEIFEKHSIPGGLCTSWEKNGYTINGCLHYIMGTGPGSSFYKMWTELINMDEIPYFHHDIWLEIEVKENRNKYGNKIFKLYTNIDQIEKYMLDLAPEDKKAIKFFTRPMRIMQKFDLPPIMDKLPFFKSMWRGIKMMKYLQFLFIFLRYKSETNKTLAKKFKNPFLRESFELLYDDDEVNLMVIQMPISVFDKKSGGYPIGGSLSFSKRLEQEYIKLGGKMHYNTPVRQITHENGAVTGVVVRNNVFHPADIVLSSADWNFTVFNLLEGKFANQHMLDLRNLQKFELFFSIVQFSFGINKDLSDQPHYSRFPLDKEIISPDGNRHSRLEVHVYNYDPTLAPEGKTTVTVSFYTKNGQYWVDQRKNDRPKYRQDKLDFFNQIVDALDQRLGGIKDKIEMTDIATPATVLRYTNNWNGSTQGWLPGKNLLAPSPVKFQLKGLKNFYMASHWNQPGGGLPVAITVGRDVTKLICKHNRVEFTTKRLKEEKG